MDWLVGKRSSETDGYTGRHPLSVFPLPAHTDQTGPGSRMGLDMTVVVAAILVFGLNLENTVI